MFETFKEYFEKRIDLIKLDVTEKSAMISGSVYFLVIVLLFLIFFLIFFTVGIALWIGSLLGNYSYGFLIMSGICLLAFLIMLARRKAIQRLAANTFIKLLNG